MNSLIGLTILAQSENRRPSGEGGRFNNRRCIDCFCAIETVMFLYLRRHSIRKLKAYKQCNNMSSDLCFEYVSTPLFQIENVINSKTIQNVSLHNKDVYYYKTCARTSFFTACRKLKCNTTDTFIVL